LHAVHSANAANPNRPEVSISRELLSALGQLFGFDSLNSHRTCSSTSYWRLEVSRR
jgi:hypothetical protein